MDNKEILAGNKLIAEFMGGVLDSPQSKYYYFTEKGRYETELKYHSSWDWLMLVVEKIESLNDNEGDFDCHFEILRDACIIVAWHGETIIEIYTNTKIEAVWLACLEFIKWYNEQPK